MSTWDVFHSDRLEVERGLTSAEVRDALARGELRDDDLIRPAGSADPWSRLADLAGLLQAESEADATGEAMPTLVEPGPGPESDETGAPPGADREEPIPTALIDDSDDEIDLSARFGPVLDAFDSGTHRLGPGEALPFDEEVADLDLGGQGEPGGALDEIEDEYDPQDEDEEAAEFTLARGSAEKVEELDLAAMVDVAFQLVLFFLVTATTVLYKTLEVPRPNPEKAPGATLPGQGRTLEDLQQDYILVEIDPSGAVKVDHEAAPADLNGLAERLRAARTQTGRTAMLLSADAATLHRNAVTAYDAANEIGLRIAIARPGQGTPAPPAAANKGGAG